MRAELSIVVPTLDSAMHLPGCFAALFEGLEAGLIRELVIADGGSQDATLAIADEAGAIIVERPASRGGQLRAGAAAAGGPWLLFLHADTVLSDGWVDAVNAHMCAAPNRAGYFRLGFDDAGGAARIVAGWANLRSRLFGLPFGDQGLLISRRLHDRLGGFDDIPLMEDVALARKLGRRRLTPLPATARTSAARYAQEGWLRRGARNLSLQARFFAGVSPERLARRYRRSAPRS